MDELEYALCPPSGLKYGGQIFGCNDVLQIYTIAEYPDEYNPYLSMQYQFELGRMDPRTFVKHILSELSIKERESLMREERWRRKSFLAGWPHEGRENQNGIAMSMSGLYYLGESDRVQCAFCRGILHHWSADDNPFYEHPKLFITCKFSRGLESNNIPYAPHRVNNADLAKITVYKPPVDGERIEETRMNPLGIIPQHFSEMAQFADEARRRASFRCWNAEAEEKVKAGFYHTQFGDKVRCYSCKVGISAWAEEDNPWVEHARWSPECGYLFQMMGRDFTNDAHDSIPPHMQKSMRKFYTPPVESGQKNTKEKHMYDVCIKLGYSTQLIDKAISENSGSFVNVSEMLDRIQAIKNPHFFHGQDEFSEHFQQLCSIYSSESSDYDLDRMFGDRPRTGVQFRKGEQSKYLLGCKDCEIIKDAFEPATNIGLPCGHLIFCDECSVEAEARANDDQSVHCPYYKCKTPILGTMKVRLA